MFEWQNIYPLDDCNAHIMLDEVETLRKQTSNGYHRAADVNYCITKIINSRTSKTSGDLKNMNVSESGDKKEQKCDTQN